MLETIRRNAFAVSFAALAAALFTGCAATTPVAIQNEAASPQSVAAVYEGTLPAADGPGIRTTLYLRANGTYTRISDYIDRNFTDAEDGRWKQEGRILIMTPASDEPYRLAAEEKSVRFLDRDGNDITGPLAPLYVLKKL